MQPILVIGQGAASRMGLLPCDEHRILCIWMHVPRELEVYFLYVNSGARQSVGLASTLVAIKAMCVVVGSV